MLRLFDACLGRAKRRPTSAEGQPFCGRLLIIIRFQFPRVRSGGIAYGEAGKRVYFVESATATASSFRENG